MDDADVVRDGIPIAFEMHRFPVNAHLAEIRLVNARDDLHERGFTGAVLAHQRVDLARFKLNGHMIQRSDARKLLCDISYFQHMLHSFLRRHGALVFAVRAYFVRYLTGSSSMI